MESEEDIDSATRNAYSSTVGRVRIISAEEHTKNQTMDAARYAFWGALVIVPALFALFYKRAPEPASSAPKKEKTSKKKR